MTYNLSLEAVPIIINHVKAVLAQHQRKIEEINSTPSWQQSNMGNSEDPKLAQSQVEWKSSPNFGFIASPEGLRHDSLQNNSTTNSNQASPSSQFPSSCKKPNQMAAISEDIFESQQNTSAKKTRNNDDLKYVRDLNSSGKRTSKEFVISQKLQEQDLSISVTSVRNKARKNIAGKKRFTPSDYSKLIQGFQGTSVNNANSKVQLGKAKLDSQRKFIASTEI
jgi:hypothetical protein